MGLFDYSGQLPQGELFEGTIEAPDQETATRRLASMGVIVLTLQPTKRATLRLPLSLDDFTFLNEQVARITSAQLPLETSLRQLATDVGSKRLKAVLLQLARDLEDGASLEEALERQRSRFPLPYDSVVRAGVATGDLAGTLYGLTTHLRLKSDTWRTLLEAAAYPLAVLALAFVIVWFYLTQIVPGLEELLREYVAERRMPAFAEVMFSISAAWPTVSIIALSVAGVLVITGLVLALPFAAGPRDAVLRKLPLVGQVYGSSVLARFCHTSALAAHAQRPLPELVAASGAASGSTRLTQATRRVAERLQQGDALSSAARDEAAVPGLWTCAVETAGPRGDLAATLSEVAKLYEVRARQWLGTLRIVVGPLLFLLVLVLLGGMLAGVLALVSVFLNVINSLSA